MSTAPAAPAKQTNSTLETEIRFARYGVLAFTLIGNLAAFSVLGAVCVIAGFATVRTGIEVNTYTVFILAAIAIAAHQQRMSYVMKHTELVVKR